MTPDVPATPGDPHGRRYRAWDGTLWNDRDSRDVHNHTHPTSGGRAFSPLSWTDDDQWGSITGCGRGGGDNGDSSARNRPVGPGHPLGVPGMARVEVKEHHITATRVYRMTDQQYAFLLSPVGRRGGHRLDVTDNTTGEVVTLHTENIESTRPR